MDAKTTLIMAGGAIKSLGEIEVKGRDGALRRVGQVEGMLCLFSTADDPDATSERDFFDASTEFKMVEGMPTPIYYHHGLTFEVSVKQIGVGTLHRTEAGIEVKADLWLDDADGAQCYADAGAGELGWSSGTAAHLVVRERVVAKSGAISHRITHWPLGLDASLTPTPAEPRNVATAVKSHIDFDGETIETWDGQTMKVPMEVADTVTSLRIQNEILLDELDLSIEREMRALRMQWLQRDLIDAQIAYLREIHQGAQSGVML